MTSLAMPEFSAEPGFYTNETELHLTHPSDHVTIHYTLDGSRPTTASDIYTKPILIQDRSNEPNILSEIPTGSSSYWEPPDGPVKKATVIRAKAVTNEGKSSPVRTATYIIDEKGADRYTLPVISLASDTTHFFSDDTGIYVEGTNNNFLNRGREWERPVNLEFYDRHGSRILSQNAGVRIHGGATRLYGQKSLRLYARSDYGRSRFYHRIFPDQPYLEYNRLLLRNSGNDWQNTMFRDALAQYLVRHLNMDTQASRPVIVFLNGEYWGIHNIRERYDRHYLERVYGVDPENVDLLTGNRSVKEGDSQHYDELMDFLYTHDLSDDTHLEQVAERIDLDNLLDYFSSQIYFGNRDWPQNNIDYWRLRTSFDPDAPAGHDGRWRWMMFDIDYSFGFSFTDHNTDMLDWLIKQHWSTDLFRILLENESFRHQLINRVAGLLNTAFQIERVTEVIDSMSAGLSIFTLGTGR